MFLSRIAPKFETLKSAGRKALIPYITAGDPHPDYTVGLMHALVSAGADILELGIPFSDPMADGPVIQLACERALKHHTSLQMVVDMVKQFRQQDADTPVVLMGYLNPIEIMGLERFSKSASEAGIDGVLIVDLAVEEAPEYVPTLKKHGLDSIFLLAPTSPEARIRAAAELAGGYLYYVSLKGVTGAANLDLESVSQKMAEIRRSTDLPVAVGFGIRDAQTARSVAGIADGVVVGSALVSEIQRNAETPGELPDRLAAKLRPLREAMDQGSVG